MPAGPATGESSGATHTLPCYRIADGSSDAAPVNFRRPRGNGVTQSDPVTLVIVNGHVYTADGHGTVAEAVAIRRNRIAAVGTTADMRALAGEDDGRRCARRLGAAGIPRIAHPFSFRRALADEANLLDASTFEEVMRAIRDFAAKRPERPWVAGRG